MTKLSFTIALALSAASLCTAAAPAYAQTAVAPENVTAEDVVTEPLSDLNINNAAVAPVLVAAQERPYDLSGLRTCRAIQSEVAKLDEALGDDIDVTVELSRDEKRGNVAGTAARTVLSSFIPFRGIIREVSGAAAHDRRWQVTLYAGASRRAFLKGYGQARGCSYPARSATAADVARVARGRDAKAEAAQAAKKQKRKKKR